MLKRILILILLQLSSSIYAQTSATIEQGAANYDWQACVTEKSGSCINGCQTSTDTDCNHNCKQMAVDKCKSEGLREP